MYYILYTFLPIVMHSIKLCAWLFLCVVVLEWVFAIWVEIMFMHFRASFFHVMLYLVWLSLFIAFFLSLSLEHLPMAPKKSTPICSLVSHASSSALVLDSLRFNDTNCLKCIQRKLHSTSASRWASDYCLSCQT